MLFKDNTLILRFNLSYLDVYLMMLFYVLIFINHNYYLFVLSEKHPSIDDLSETPETHMACVLDFDDSCSVEVNVEIRKCGKEIQYYLKSTLIYSAYCFGKSLNTLCFIL